MMAPGDVCRASEPPEEQCHDDAEDPAHGDDDRDDLSVGGLD